jgi:capsule polysaccharide export protein KpsE/RkpR
MKIILPLAGSVLAVSLLLLPAPAPADSSSNVVEKALYDKARYGITSKLTDDEFISYCVTMNLGGDTLFKFHDQILSKEFELAKLQSEGFSSDNPQVQAATAELKDLRDQFSVRLNKVRKGLEIESKIADETLSDLAQSQK